MKAMVSIIATCVMVTAGDPIFGVIDVLHHVPTTRPSSTLMTLHCVETPDCGEGFLVTHTVVEHCSDPARDVQEQFKHVLKFGILIHLEFKTPNISPGPDALTAQIRCLVNDLLATPLSISGFITTCFLAINCLLIVKEAGHRYPQHFLKFLTLPLTVVYYKMNYLPVGVRIWFWPNC